MMLVPDYSRPGPCSRASERVQCGGDWELHLGPKDYGDRLDRLEEGSLKRTMLLHRGLADLALRVA